MIKVDLHTHSIASKDGRITELQYRQVLEKGLLDCIAITDHNRIDFAQKLQTELGAERIIVGEEITTKQGDVIGLFLTEEIPAGLELVAAVDAIQAQGGLVYVPHPFETVRSGLQATDLHTIEKSVSLVESANGRAYFQNRGPEAHAWARMRELATYASSDAHCAGGLGKTYTQLKERPTVDNLEELAHTGRKIYHRPNINDILAPKLNRIGKKIGAIK
jgi:predicted metal-dependent phosphoesterase TrpH